MTERFKRDFLNCRPLSLDDYGLVTRFVNNPHNISPEEVDKRVQKYLSAPIKVKSINLEEKINKLDFFVDNTKKESRNIEQMRVERFLLDKHTAEIPMTNKYIPSSHCLTSNRISDDKVVELKDLLKRINNLTTEMLEIQKTLILYINANG